MAAVAKRKKEVDSQELSLDDILNGATSESPKKKSKLPEVCKGEAVSVAKELRKLKGQLDSIQAQFDLKASQLISIIDKQRPELLRSGYQPTISVPLPDGKVNVSYTDRYSKIPTAMKEELTELAKEKFAELFELITQITVKDTSEKTLKELIERIGPENFNRFFNVERWFKPTERYTKESVFYNDIQKADYEAAGVKPYKPSVKVS